MRLIRFFAATAALAAVALVDLGVPPAFSADLDSVTVVHKRRAARRHYVPAPAYVIDPDPYSYQYEPRGYYPYYASAYWRPAAWVRNRDRLHYNVWNRQPPLFEYYPSWGYPTRHWWHREWHASHHGHHRPWHW